MNLQQKLMLAALVNFLAGFSILIQFSLPRQEALSVLWFGNIILALLALFLFIQCFSSFGKLKHYSRVLLRTQEALYAFFAVLLTIMAVDYGFGRHHDYPVWFTLCAIFLTFAFILRFLWLRRMEHPLKIYFQLSLMATFLAIFSLIYLEFFAYGMLLLAMRHHLQEKLA